MRFRMAEELVLVNPWSEREVDLRALIRRAVAAGLTDPELARRMQLRLHHNHANAKAQGRRAGSLTRSEDPGDRNLMPEAGSSRGRGRSPTKVNAARLTEEQQQMAAEMVDLQRTIANMTRRAEEEQERRQAAEAELVRISLVLEQERATSEGRERAAMKAAAHRAEKKSQQWLKEIEAFTAAQLEQVSLDARRKLPFGPG